jgi:hypothetical protein
MATKRKAVTKKVVKKRVVAPKNLKVEILLGPVKATREQRTRLRELVTNQVLTWVRDDAMAGDVPINTRDKPGGGGGGGSN